MFKYTERVKIGDIPSDYMLIQYSQDCEQYNDMIGGNYDYIYVRYDQGQVTDIIGSFSVKIDRYADHWSHIVGTGMDSDIERTKVYRVMLSYTAKIGGLPESMTVYYTPDFFDAVEIYIDWYNDQWPLTEDHDDIDIVTALESIDSDLYGSLVIPYGPLSKCRITLETIETNYNEWVGLSERCDHMNLCHA